LDLERLSAHAFMAGASVPSEPATATSRSARSAARLGLTIPPVILTDGRQAIDVERATHAVVEQLLSVSPDARC
jgi:hypothetical protein